MTRAGIEPTAAAPCQPTRLDGSRSDHSAASKETASWRALRQRFGLTRSMGVGQREKEGKEAAEWSERLTSRRVGWLGAAAVGSIPALVTFFSFSSLLLLLFLSSLSKTYISPLCTKLFLTWRFSAAFLLSLAPVRPGCSLSPLAGSGIRTFRSTPPATFFSQLRSLSLDEYNQNRLVVISATCPKHLNERLRNPSLKRSSYHGNGERVHEMALRDRCNFSHSGCHILPKMLFCFFIYCLAQPRLLLQVIFL